MIDSTRMVPLLLGAGAGGALGLLSGKTSYLIRYLKRHLSCTIILRGAPYQAMTIRLLKENKLTDTVMGVANLEEHPTFKDDTLDDEDTSANAQFVRLAEGVRVLKLEGRKVLTNVYREKMDRTFLEEIAITCRKKHREWLTSLISTELNKYIHSDTTALNVYSSRGGYWLHSRSRPKRPIESIEHPDNIPQKMVSIIETRREESAKKKERGENSTISFLLSGPPGSGKTSTAMAIASHFNMKLAVIPPTAQSNFSSLISSLLPNTVVLIEEAEQIFFDRNKKQNTKNINTGSDKVAEALSAIDGPSTPPDLIIIYTTNFKDKIDPALLRVGRVDYDFHFPARKEAIPQTNSIKYKDKLTILEEVAK